MGMFDTFRKAPPTIQPAQFSAVGKSSTAFLATTAIAGDRAKQAITSPGIRGITKQLLFVGVGADWFQALESDLRMVQPQWTGTLAETVAQAGPALHSGAFYAVVLNPAVLADPALVAALEKQNPSVVRVVLGNSNDRAEVARWSAAGFSILPQSTDAAALSAHIRRLARVQEWMTDTAIKKLVAQCRKLPALPKLYSQVTAELSSPNGSIEVVAQCIAQDPVMTAKLLQVVNSAFFALGREVSEPTEAVMFLGAERTRSLILLAGVFTQFENVKCPGFSADQVWNHSLQVGAYARTVTLAATKNTKLAEAAFTAGLVHDMGKLILAANVPLMGASITQLQETKNLPQRDAELQVLGTTHAELAACLLGNWGLPLAVLEAVAWHHVPTRSDETSFSLLTAVHVANVFAYELASGAQRDAIPVTFDHQYLEQIQLGDHRNDWRKACQLPARLEEDAVHARFRA